MANDTKRLYEGLFLFDPARINNSVATATQVIQELLNRADADAVAIYKWDDRKLAYEIRGVKRGLYMLSYFHAAGPRIAGIERDVSLSEQVMRCLIIRADHIGETELQLAADLHKQTLDESALESVGEGDAPASANAPAPQADEAAETDAPEAAETKND